MKTIMKKVQENKATILKLLSLFLMLAVISVITMLILFATDVLSYDGGFQFNQHILDGFTGKWYGFIVLMLIQIGLSMLLCAIPGVAAAFVMISSEVLYAGRPWMAFIFSYSCVVVASAILYFIGQWGGYKICEKMLGKDDCEKSLELLRTRGTTYFPLMMLFPIFPDDALVMIAGVTKMKLSWFIPSIIVCRGVGAATIIFGMSIIPFNTFTSTFDWVILISITFFWLQQLFKIAHKVDRYFENKKRMQDVKNANAKSHVRINYIKIYFNVGAILISLFLPLIYLRKNFEIYQWMILVTVCFLWIKDMLMAIAAKYLKEKNKLGGNTLVATVMSNMGFFKFCEQNGIKCEKTKVGDRYVLENMVDNGYSIGGEQSGHIIFLEHATTGDGQLSAIQLLSVLKDTGKTLKDLADEMEVYPQVLINVRVSNFGKAQFPKDKEVQNAIKQAHEELGDDGRILVRLSGTEPLVRVMLEGKNLDKINELGESVAQVVKERLV